MTLKLHHATGAKSHIHHIRARNKRVIFRIFPIEPEGSQDGLSSLLRHREVLPQLATEFNPRHTFLRRHRYRTVSHLQPRRLRVHAIRKFELAGES